ncbi:MAG: hypothetical protein KKF46_03040 [Nanoarchaeota archaeon]|nr:hypothetical protein [Nanoarchaeota archaeon]MBU1321309.1 hypothetical protein [Nanoarchaeota archaeon]MBU1597300.1 hypothetical protein [Nanoarchaeota archaeon]MBU2441585.1 hypothetical protein [Nanoarchaeota archaeon]
MTNKINITQDIEMIVKALSKPDKPVIDLPRIRSVGKYLGEQHGELILLEDEYDVQVNPLTLGIGLLNLSCELKLIENGEYGSYDFYKRTIIFPTKHHFTFGGTGFLIRENEALFLGIKSGHERTIGHDQRNEEHDKGIEGKLNVIIGTQEIEELFIHKYSDLISSYLEAANRLDILVSPKLKQEYLKSEYHLLFRDNHYNFLESYFVEKGLHKGEYIFEPEPGLTIDVPALIKHRWNEYMEYCKKERREVPKELD